MLTAGVSDERFKQFSLPCELSFRGEPSMEQVSTRPEADIEFTEQDVQCRQTPLNEAFDLSITGERYIIVESTESEYAAAQRVRRRVGRDLFEEDTVLTDGCADTTIEDIPLKAPSRPPRQ
jgi:hypothetical protein